MKTGPFTPRQSLSHTIARGALPAALLAALATLAPAQAQALGVTGTVRAAVPSVPVEAPTLPRPPSSPQPAVALPPTVTVEAPSLPAVPTPSTPSLPPVGSPPAHSPVPTEAPRLTPPSGRVPSGSAPAAPAGASGAGAGSATGPASGAGTAGTPGAPTQTVSARRVPVRRTHVGSGGSRGRGCRGWLCSAGSSSAGTQPAAVASNRAWSSLPVAGDVLNVRYAQAPGGRELKESAPGGTLFGMALGPAARDSVLAAFLTFGSGALVFAFMFLDGLGIGPRHPLWRRRMRRRLSVRAYTARRPGRGLGAGELGASLAHRQERAQLHIRPPASLLRRRA
jgi:hypothetical protein